MKRSLAIVLTTTALVFSASSLTSGVALARYDSYSGKSPGQCGVVACVTDLAPLPSFPGPGPYRGNR